MAWVLLGFWHPLLKADYLWGVSSSPAQTWSWKTEIPKGEDVKRTCFSVSLPLLCSWTSLSQTLPLFYPSPKNFCEKKTFNTSVSLDFAVRHSKIEAEELEKDLILLF